MSEGRLYRVLWNRGPDCFEVRLARQPGVSATGKSVDEALDRLAVLVLEKYGDGEPQWKLDAPLDVDPAIAGFRRFVVVVPYASWEVEVPAEALFAGPRCDVCESLHGRRTAHPLSLAKRDGSAHLANWVAEAGVTGVVLDEIALKQLPTALWSEFEVVPCAVDRRRRTQWFELQPRWSVHEVRWKRLKYQAPNQESTRAHQRYDPGTSFVPHAPCPACGGYKPYDYDTCYPGAGEKYDAYYVAAEDLPVTDPQAFALQLHKNWMLAIDPLTWEAVRLSKAFANVFDDTVCCALPSVQVAGLDDTMAKRAWPAEHEAIG